MRITGYKLNGYNATYERTNFDVREYRNADKSRVLEVTEIETGVSYILEVGENLKSFERRNRIKAWHSESIDRDPKQHGKTIVIGQAGKMKKGYCKI